MIVKIRGSRNRAEFNARKYGDLLARTLPAVIRTRSEYDHAIEEIEKMLKKGKNITPEEERLLDLLSTLVERYEEEHFSIAPVAPHEMIQHLMEARDLKQKDMVYLFGSSGRASEAINGVRPLSKSQAKALAEYFHVSVELFI